MGQHTVAIALVTLLVFAGFCWTPSAAARVLAQDVLAAPAPQDQLAPAEAPATAAAAIPENTEVAEQALVFEPPTIVEPATPEPVVQAQGPASDVLKSTVLDLLLGNAGTIGGIVDGTVSAAAAPNVLDLTATGATTGKTPELMAINVGHRVLRHGHSKANETGVIVSSLENGIKQEYGLAASGLAQAAAAGQLLQQQLSQIGAQASSVIIYSSPFSRTLETARAAAAAAGIDASSCMHVTPLLAERYFGSVLELTSHDNYCPFWDSDARNPSSRPAGSEDGESVEQVSQRVQQLFQELEQQHQGQHILLVSHGDTLSILQATFHGRPLSRHRQYGLATAELKCLNPPRAAAAGAAAADADAGATSRELAGVGGRS